MHSKYIRNKKAIWQLYVFVFLFVLITFSIFYFSWISDNELSSESYLPLWLRDWSNTYFNLRTAVPFVAFGFLLKALLPVISGSNKKGNTLAAWLLHTAIALAVVCLAEGGQFFILNRHPDFMDVLFAVLGSQVGFVIFYICLLIHLKF
jgi:glycopeptide antibiotics resistance protein